jgi:predicted metal-binding membrane protein
VSQPAARVASLPRPVSATIVAALLVCAAAAWLFTITQANSMSMGGGLAMIGAGLFLITWLVMMVAMMFPSVAPMTLAFASVTRARGEGSTPTVAFVAGYLLVWTAAGVIPLAVVQVLNQVWMTTPPSWLPRVSGAVIIVAGIYQFTPLKDTCLRACRTPLGFVLSHNFGGGSVAAVRAGASHGLYCLGCCWALMAVLAVLGLMNIAWMAVIAAIFFIEKNVRRGELLPRLVGVACVIGGLAVIVWPALLGGGHATM